MAIPQYSGTGLAISGTALSIFGQIQANIAQARKEEENARWLRQQADFFAEVSEREHGIARREGLTQIGEQTGSFISGGIELEGSALDLLNSSFANLSRELEAIKLQGFMNQREALLKASASDFNASELSSFRNNLLSSLGSGFSGAAGAIGTFRKEQELGKRNAKNT